MTTSLYLFSSIAMVINNNSTATVVDVTSYYLFLSLFYAVHTYPYFYVSVAFFKNIINYSALLLYYSVKLFKSGLQKASIMCIYSNSLFYTSSNLSPNIIIQYFKAYWVMKTHRYLHRHKAFSRNILTPHQ